MVIFKIQSLVYLHFNINMDYFLSFVCLFLQFIIIILFIFLMLKFSQFWSWEPIQADVFGNDCLDSLLSCRGILDFQRPEISL